MGLLFFDLPVRIFLAHSAYNRIVNEKRQSMNENDRRLWNENVRVDVGKGQPEYLLF